MESQLWKDLQDLSLLFDKEEKWIKNKFAQNANGWVVDSCSPNAVCWCLHGGINKITNISITRRENLVRVISEQTGENIIAWNDQKERTFADITAVINHAKKKEFAAL